MLFTFKRDEEMSLTIHVNDTRLAIIGEHEYDGSLIWTLCSSPPKGVEAHHIDDAIERADEAGLWLVSRPCRAVSYGDFINNEVTVDVPVADNAVLTVETEEGEEA